MSMSALINGADCGPVNPLQGLSKQLDRDRGIQQVRQLAAVHLSACLSILAELGKPIFYAQIFSAERLMLMSLL